MKGQYELGQKVYLYSDSEQKERMVIGILFHIGNSIEYELACADVKSWHYGDEVTSNQDCLKKLLQSNEA